MAKKFNLNEQTSPPKAKKFIIEPEGSRKQPKVVIANAAFNYGKKLFYKLGSPEPSDENVGLSKILNTPVYTNIIFKSGDYTDENGDNQTFNELKIDLVLIEVNNTKNIVTTTLQGRNGTVKEYISDGDYNIKIEGKIFGDGANNYPESEVQSLHEICLAPQAINVESDFLKLFGIANIVIQNYSFPQEEGVRNYQKFTLDCLSDKELILLKNA